MSLKPQERINESGLGIGRDRKPEVCIGKKEKESAKRRMERRGVLAGGGNSVYKGPGAGMCG